MKLNILLSAMFVFAFNFTVWAEESPQAKAADPASEVKAEAAINAAQTALASGELDAGVKVNILGIKRTSGDTVTLTFELDNSSQEPLKIEELLSDQGYYNWDVSKINLLDPANKKKYLVMRDSAKTCVCSRGATHNHEVKPGTKRTLWAKFQAPPAQVGKLTVEFPGAQPFEDLAVTQ